MTINEIIQGCWLGGCSLEQRSAVCSEREAALISEHLRKPQAERDRIFLKAIRGL